MDEGDSVMLDVMRRNIKSLAFTLWIVIGSFIFFIFVQWGMGRAERATGKSVIASINNEPIYADTYQETFQAQLRRMKDMFQQRMDRQMIQQLGLESSVIESLIAEELLVQEAERLGLVVSDSDVRDAILNNPNLQQNGRFIGKEQYERLLMMNKKTPAQFESELRRELLISKLRQLVTLPLTVSDAEVRTSYYETSEKVKIAFMMIKSVPDLYPGLIDAEVRSYFEKNHPRFDIPERRKGRYILLEVDRIRQKVNLTQKDIQSYYSDHIEQFRTEEQIDAQKIVVKWENRTKEEAKALATALLGRARKGEDFGKLARENSEDPLSAANGGETGPLTKGGLSEAEEAVLINQPEGSINEPIETDTAWVIYKINKKTPASERSLQEAEPQIRTILSWQKARQATDKKITEILHAAQEAKSLDKVAQTNSLTVKDSPLLAKGDEVPGLGDAGQFSQALFGIKKGEIDGPLHAGNGAIVYSVTDIEAPRPAKFEEVADKVRKALSGEKRREEAIAKAQQALAEIQAGAKTEDVAKKMSAAVKEQEFARNSYIEEVGNSSYLDDRAFGMEPGSTWTGPVSVKNGACIFRVVEKKPVADADFENKRESTRESLLQDKRNRFFDSYLQLLRKKNRVTVNTEALGEVNDMLLSRFS